MPAFFIFLDEITASFRRFGPLVVDWPHKAESKSYFPPKGYAFLLFQVIKTREEKKMRFAVLFVLQALLEYTSFKSCLFVIQISSAIDNGVA